MKIIIASDHAGFLLKEEIKSYLCKWQFRDVVDVGCDSENRCDFPDYANKLCQMLLESNNDVYGIIICGTGIGMSMACNKYDNQIRCALCHNEYTAKQSRNHLDANVLALAGRMIAPVYANLIVHKFLTEPFIGGEYNRRVDKLSRRL